jgi:Plavaka transposase
MKDENLIFKDNLFEDPNDHSDAYIEDINDGSCYKSAYRIFCKDRAKDVLCPIILFIDKTHTDAKGNQTLEPVCMTLGIFNATTRNKENAWRIIGFIPSSSTIPTRKINAEQKRSDYHAMLKVVIAPLEELQKSNGVNLQMAYKGSTFSVSLRIPILFISGDSVGQDQLVGRQMKYHGLTENAHLCRYCDIPYRHSDNPSYKSKRTRASDIAKYIKERNTARLNEIGYYAIDENALHGLSFCDNKYGLNGSLPADLLHTFQLGILIYVVEGFFTLKRPNQESIDRFSKKRKRRNNVSSARLDDDSLSLSVEERSSLNVFNDLEKDIFDERAKKIGKALSQQSDRDLPRTHFPTGITGDKKKNAHEMQGVVLDIMYVVLSDLSKYNRLMGNNEYGARRLSNWLLLLERLLMIEEFLRTGTIKRKHVEIFSIYFPFFLEYLKKVVDRQSAAKFKLLKFHLCTHFASDIMKWGPHVAITVQQENPTIKL